MDEIAVLIPCYNEAKTIKDVVEGFRKSLPEAKIYVYDNNSTDRTDEIAQKAGAIVRYEHRQGKGNVIRSMFREIEAKCYIMVDGDNTYSPNDARKMVQYILNDGYDMVVGDRLSSSYFKENKRMFHGFGNRLVRRMVNDLFHGEVNDIMTGYRAFSRLFVKSFPVLSKGFEIETEMTIHALDKNFSIISTMVEYKDREEGSVSKLNTYKDGIKVIWTVIKTFKDYKPLSFFGLLSFLFFGIGVGLIVPIFIEFVDTGLVPRFPTFIGAMFLILISIQLITCGLILDSIIRHDRKNFEISLNMIRESRE